MWVVVALGGVAAASIYAGMPIARSRRIGRAARTALAAGAMGVLLFLFFDITSTARAAIAGPLSTDPTQGLFLAALFAGGFALGAVVLPLLLRRVRPASPPARAPAPSSGVSSTPSGLGRVSPLGVSTAVAVAIGVHNFSEGLAVGAAYTAGVIALSLLLAVAVIAHKATEGYCICGCTVTAARSYTYRQLAVLGLIGGAPVLVGSIVGSSVGVDPSGLMVVFGVAAGALISVVVFMLTSGLLRTSRSWVMAGIAAGFLLTLATDLALSGLGL